MMTLKYTDTIMKEESRYSGRVVMYKIISRYRCTKIVTKPLFGKRHLAPQNVHSCRKLERTTRLATWAAHAAVKYFHDEQSTNKTNKQFQTKNLRMSKAFHPNYFSYGPYFAGLQNLQDHFFGVHLLPKQLELHSFRRNITIRSPIRGCRANRQRWFWSLLEDNCKACAPRTALARPLI